MVDFARFKSDIHWIRIWCEPWMCSERPNAPPLPYHKIIFVDHYFLHTQTDNSDMIKKKKETERVKKKNEK